MPLFQIDDIEDEYLWNADRAKSPEIVSNYIAVVYFEIPAPDF